MDCPNSTRYWKWFLKFTQMSGWVRVGSDQPTKFHSYFISCSWSQAWLRIFGSNKIENYMSKLVPNFEHLWGQAWLPLTSELLFSIFYIMGVFSSWIIKSSSTKGSWSTYPTTWKITTQEYPLQKGLNYWISYVKNGEEKVKQKWNTTPRERFWECI